MYTPEQRAAFCGRFRIPDQPAYFPESSFLETGYAPIGGYVKDFGILRHEGRWHVFHIDGRPGEVCHMPGNEISFGHASTADCRHWIRHRTPVTVGDREWEREHVWAPFVYPWRGGFYMFYMACGYRTGSVITYATSPDLEVWTKWMGGPVPGARGRDPFVREHDGRHWLYYTGDGGIHACATEDMVRWADPRPVMRNPERPYAESCSVHPFRGRYVLWYNDYLHADDGTGDFRPVYIVSDDPLAFDPADLRVFDFTTPLPTTFDPSDWISRRPIPISIELMADGGDHWFIAYFRWHEGKYRLFFGLVDWTRDPAHVEELVDEARLAEAIRLTGLEVA